MQVREHELLAPHTTFKIGGEARYFIDAHSGVDVEEAIRFARERSLPLFILGGGSNLLFPDNGFHGVVLHMRTQGLSWHDDGDNVFLTAGAGCNWDHVVAESVARGASGIENLSLIPGTVGGAVVQNIGAYGVEIGDHVESVDVLDLRSLERKTFPRAECDFVYRNSLFKRTLGAFVVLAATLRLSRRFTPNILYKDLATHFLDRGIVAPSQQEVRDAVVGVRLAKFPDLSKVGTAGSFFKNPVVSSDLAREFCATHTLSPAHDVGDGSVKLSAGWIIDHVLHMKGVRDGRVGCWKDQALVLVNYGGATSDEVKKFVRVIQKNCFDATRITLEPEVIIVSDEMK